MEQLQFSEVRQLLNACRLTEISDTPINSEKGRWELYEGAYKVHIFKHKFSLLYFFSDVRKEDLRAAKRAFIPNETIVVYAPSVSILPSIKELFSNDAMGLWSTPEYLRSFMINELTAYREKLIEDNPQDYIAPGFAVPAGLNRKYPNPITLFLQSPNSGSENESQGSLAVVLAEAGHGKTYLCQWLVARLARDDTNILPIYVNSAQWKLLRNEDLVSLERTLVSSFRGVGTPIPWLEGQEDLFLKVALKAGLFRIIFDGFDEYVLRNPSEINAIDVFDSLQNLVRNTGTKVVITSRSSFWSSELTDQLQDEQHETYSQYSINPFGAEQAKQYFEIKFRESPEKIGLAERYFRDLNKDDASLAGRGFVLRLISDLVKSGYSNDGDTTSDKPLMKLIRAHCDRETVRHSLPITSGEQIEALANFVFEIAQGEQNTSETLSYSISSVVPGLSDDAILGLLEKMAPHALIVRERGSWNVRQQQVQVALLADKLVKFTEKGEQLFLLKRFSNKAKIDLSEGSDLASMIVSITSWGKSPTDAIEKIRTVIKCFFDNSESNLDAIRGECLRMLSTLIAYRALEIDSSIKTQKERSTLFASFFPEPNFKGVVFYGGITKLDLSGFIFEKCIFDNVRWANCTFDKLTTIRNSRVLGGSETYCTGFQDISFHNIQTDESGRDFLNNVDIRHGKKKYSEELLRKDLYFALEQFIGKGGVGFKSVEQSLLGRSKISSSIHKEKILNEIKSNLLEQHHVSTASRVAFSISDSAKDSVKSLISNNMLSGLVFDVFVQLKSKLID